MAIIRQPLPYARRPRFTGLGGLGDDTSVQDFIVGGGTFGFDAGGSSGGGFSQPYIGSTASTGSSGSTNWMSFVLSAMKLAPNIISAGRGNQYQSGQYGQAGGQGGLNLTGSSILGGGSLGISSSTLMLFGLGLVVIFMMKK